jgi:aromatic ring-opening dioxygenase catalytic subunit (LigB family)
MAEIVSVHAVSHTPVMLNFPHAIEAHEREAIFAAFAQVGRDILQAAPDTLVVVSDDHLHNFFLNNFPAFCIGTAPAYQTPVEHWLKAERQVLAGDAELGAYLLGEALRNDFDPAFSMDLTLDHGVLVPLQLAGLAGRVRVLPLIVNCVQPPLPTMSRTLQWGRFIGRALRSHAGCRRVAVLATGGLSHDVGTPRMGAVNEDFDRRFLQLLAAGDDQALAEETAARVNEAGNGAEEVRNWLVAHGAAGGAPFETMYYKAVPGWYTGIGLARWRMGGRG